MKPKLFKIKTLLENSSENLEIKIVKNEINIPKILPTLQQENQRFSLKIRKHIFKKNTLIYQTLLHNNKPSVKNNFLIHQSIVWFSSILGLYLLPLRLSYWDPSF